MFENIKKFKRRKDKFFIQYMKPLWLKYLCALFITASSAAQFFSTVSDDAEINKHTTVATLSAAVRQSLTVSSTSWDKKC